MLSFSDADSGKFSATGCEDNTEQQQAFLHDVSSLSTKSGIVSDMHSASTYYNLTVFIYFTIFIYFKNYVPVILVWRVFHRFILCYVVPIYIELFKLLNLCTLIKIVFLYV